VNLSFARPPEFFQQGYRPLSALSTERLRRRHERLARPRQRNTGERLFLTVVPPHEVAQRLARLARHLKIGHDLSGRPFAPEHFHVTLCALGDGPGVGSNAVARAMDCAAGLAMPPFKVVFDRVGSFPNGEVVLRGCDSTIGLEVLQQRLSDALDGSPQPARPFTPHLTLLRDRHRVPEHEIEPIEWQVREVVLARGALRTATYHRLARVPLA
jgi:RNA 2',3'-cyclic 3'-phosphodiesterase